METNVTNLDNYPCPKVQNLISEKKKVIGSVSTNHFVMQRLFNVQKEKHLHTEDGLDVFLTISKTCKSFSSILYLKILKINQYPFFNPKLRLLMVVTSN